MKVFVGKELREFAEKNMKQYIDLDVQVQQVGIDLTLNYAVMPVARATVDFDNKYREIASHKKIGLSSSIYENLRVFPLYAKNSYILYTNEIVKMDRKHFAIAYPRSTLTRSGVVLSSAVVDPGYVGTLHFSIYTPVDLYLAKNARIAQLIIYELDDDAPEYEGVYKYTGVEVKQ